jgi:hypothetical protein
VGRGQGSGARGRGLTFCGEWDGVEEDGLPGAAVAAEDGGGGGRDVLLLALEGVVLLEPASDDASIADD